jgi:septum formation protein
MQPLKFILASASPARRQLLQSAGINPLVQASQFDESQVQIQDPQALVRVLAASKAESIAAQQTEPALVLGCDSVLALQGEIYGKPENAEQAIARWQKMRGQTGDLLTGHALLDLYQHKTLVRVQVTQVEFAKVSDRQIAAYVATGEPLQCAGCFALDGRGGLFIEKIIGCHSNVIGLSLPLLRQMLTDLDYDVIDFWS